MRSDRALSVAASSAERARPEHAARPRARRSRRTPAARAAFDELDRTLRLAGDGTIDVGRCPIALHELLTYARVASRTTCCTARTDPERLRVLEPRPARDLGTELRRRRRVRRRDLAAVRRRRRAASSVKAMFNDLHARRPASPGTSLLHVQRSSRIRRRARRGRRESCTRCLATGSGTIGDPSRVSEDRVEPAHPRSPSRPARLPAAARASSRLVSEHRA